MAIGFLPHFDMCCGSIELRLGTIIIGVLCILCCGIGYGHFASAGLGCWTVFNRGILESMAGTLLEILFYAGFAFLVAGILIIVGVFAEMKILLTIAVWIMFVLAILFIISRLIVLLHFLIRAKYCGAGAIVTAVLQFIFPISFLYFVCVVNTYEEGA